MNIKIGDLVTVKNARKYDALAPKEVNGIVYIIWSDGCIGVSTPGNGSMKVKYSDIKKRSLRGR